MITADQPCRGYGDDIVAEVPLRDELGRVLPPIESVSRLYRTQTVKEC